MAAGILRRGGLVAFPTETVYGLGASALDPDAVKKIFLAKQRPGWDPLIVHISDTKMLATVADMESAGVLIKRLMDTFWPGPLTLLLPKTEKIPSIVTAGRDLVGVRMPAHPIARALIAATGLPIAAPSANNFGRVSPTRADHVLEDLDGRIDAVLDGGATTHGLESTVVDASKSPLVLYRPGAISIEALRAVCGEAIEWKPPVGLREALPSSLPSPGVGIKHYAPRAKVVVVEGVPNEASGGLLQAVYGATQKYCRIGVLLPRSYANFSEIQAIEGTIVFDWGEWTDAEDLAHNLFAGLRTLDDAEVQVIVCPLPEDRGLGAAIRDRLLKAAKD